MRAAVLRQAALGEGQAALGRYRAMSADAAEEFDARYGVNQHAAPKIGQSYTIAEKETGAKGWSFHWAFVILQLGDDRVTLENSARSGFSAQGAAGVSSSNSSIVSSSSSPVGSRKDLSW